MLIVVINSFINPKNRLKRRHLTVICPKKAELPIFKQPLFPDGNKKTLT